MERLAQISSFLPQLRILLDTANACFEILAVHYFLTTRGIHYARLARFEPS